MAQHGPAAGSSADDILRAIAQKEQQLQDELADARRAGARRVAEAAQEADAIRARAREQVQQESQTAAASAAAEAQSITEDVLARARAEAAAIRKRADERIREAVALVVREVLGEHP